MHSNRRDSRDGPTTPPSARAGWRRQLGCCAGRVATRAMLLQDGLDGLLVVGGS